LWPFFTCPLGQVKTIPVADVGNPSPAYTVGEVQMTRIMIADPDPASRKALALLLTRKLEVETIYEADEMDSLLRQMVPTSPNILLLADSLPGLDLPETCHMLRRDFPNLTIVLLSLDECACEKAAICQTEFIHKGACMDETLSRLQAILGKTK
jgi:DNA-binding NarL/FixJ family response regulator